MTDVTRAVARYALRSRWSDLPPAVQHEGKRIFLNWLGCALRGSGHPAVASAEAAIAEFAGPPQATVLGRGIRMDIASAALLNGLSASAYAFDDTHLDTIAHPSAPSGAALLALAERRPLSGKDFLHALILANEIQCRLSKALAVAPAKCHVGLYMTGITGGFGVAAAVGTMLGLSEQQMIWAMGIGATQGSGFRATHASMASGFVPAHAGRSGLVAALMAAKGFTCTDQFLEARNGFADVFAGQAHLAALTDQLGEQFECMSVAAKPYPAGVFIHPAIEACLTLSTSEGIAPNAIERVQLQVHPLGVGLTGKREPQGAYDAQVSVYHWAAAALVNKAAGLPEASDAAVADPSIVAMRRRIVVNADTSLHANEAIVTAEMQDGTTRRVHVPNCLGSAARPMSDRDLEGKFLAQAIDVLPRPRAEQLVDTCWNLHSAADVSRAAPGIWGN
ncbi:MAG: MmgE/PrpD family protein [Burkholderiales bacterium]